MRSLTLPDLRLQRNTLALTEQRDATMESMVARIHDDEVDTSEAVARALLTEHLPHLAPRRLTPLHTSGTDNTMWRLASDGPRNGDLVMRLPRMSRAVDSLRKEVRLLPLLEGSPLADIVQVPTLHYAGDPSDVFPFHWAVFGWIAGADAWQCRDEIDASTSSDQHTLATDLARAVAAIGKLSNMPLDSRADGDRGGPLPALLDRLEHWLHDPAWSASDLIDVAAVRRSVAESREAAIATGPGSPAPSVVHGDLIAGNLVLHERRLNAIIDWGGAAYGDPAQDVAPAWSVLDHIGRRTFREVLGVDDTTWLRGRAFELEHAVGGILYYTPRQHPLADVMTRTLRRILTDE